MSGRKEDFLGSDFLLNDPESQPTMWELCVGGK